jgi:hypothetical protein
MAGGKMLPINPEHNPKSIGEREGSATFLYKTGAPRHGSPRGKWRCVPMVGGNADWIGFSL